MLEMRTTADLRPDGSVHVIKLGNRTAIVTGAASGIGQAIARLFAKEKARVALVDIDESGVKATADQIQNAGGTVRAHVRDVSNSGDAEKTVAAILKDWGTVDILVPAAGISVGKVLTDTTEEEWDRVFAVNVKGTAFWCKAALPHMMENRRGAIVTISSQFAFTGGPASASYVATKGAIVSLTRSIAIDYASYRIRANTVMPASIDTPMIQRMLARQPDQEQALQRVIGKHPLGRIGTPEEVALAVLYLASDDSSFTSGATLPVNGGWLTG